MNSSPVKDSTVEIVSFATRKLLWICAGVLVFLHIFAAIVLPLGDTGVHFYWTDSVALVLVGLLLAVLLLWGTRPRILVHSQGISIRNLTDSTFYPWNTIERFDFEKYFAYAVLPEEERVILLAVCILDKERALHNMNILRKNLSHYRNTHASEN